MSKSIFNRYSLYGYTVEKAEKIIILLHGRNQSCEDIYKVALRIGLDKLCYIIPSSGSSWYPEKLTSPIEKNQSFLDSALSFIGKIVEDLNLLNISSKQIILMGFSQGACLAAEYVYRNADKCGGLVAFSGGFLGASPQEFSYIRQSTHIPVIISGSILDKLVPVSRLEETAKAFELRGANVNCYIYSERGHKVTDEEIKLATGFLQIT